MQDFRETPTKQLNNPENYLPWWYRDLGFIVLGALKKKSPLKKSQSLNYDNM